MPALTRKAKRRHADSLEDEEGSNDEAVVGILAQRAARRQAAREAERLAQQVRLGITSFFSYISHPFFLYSQYLR